MAVQTEGDATIVTCGVADTGVVFVALTQQLRLKRLRQLLTTQHERWSRGMARKVLSAKYPVEPLRSHRRRLSALGAAFLVVAASASLSFSAMSGAPASAQSGLDDQFLAVSCANANYCMAVGDQTSGASLAELWNGKAWTAQPDASVSNSELTGVSCVTDGSVCVAVGYVGVYDGLIAEVWNGTSWTIEYPPPDVKGTASNYYFRSVSCQSANLCEAVGGAPNGTLAQGWNGSRWSMQTTQNPTGTDGVGTQLESVSCRGGDRCTAVGGWTNQKNVFKEGTLAEGYHGHWGILDIPSPSHNTFPVLYGVSCESSEGCEAVGTQQPSGTTVPLAEGHVNPSKWAIQSAPDTGLASYTEVTGVSCGSSPPACIAVGWYYDSESGADDAITMAFNGSNGWDLQSRQPVQPNYRQVMNGIWCTAPSSCEAVGTQYDTSGAGMTLAEFWNGTAWKVQSTQNP